MCSDNEGLGWCMFMQFARISNMSPLSAAPSEGDLPILTMEQFEKGSNHFISLITDAEQLSFFIKGFAKGEQIKRSEVQQLIEAAYQLAHLHTPQLCPQVAKTVVDAAMHSKESVDTGFLCKWFIKHCHRLVYWMHRHIANIIASSTPSFIIDQPQPSSDPILAPAATASTPILPEQSSTGCQPSLPKSSVESLFPHRRPSNSHRRLSIPHLSFNKTPSSDRVEMQGLEEVCKGGLSIKSAMHRAASVPGHTGEAVPPLDHTSLMSGLSLHNSVSVLFSLGQEDTELSTQVRSAIVSIVFILFYSAIELLTVPIA